MSNEVLYSEIIKNNYNLSSSVYDNNTCIKCNKIKLIDLIDSQTKGEEIGSDNYIKKSEYYFMRTSAIIENSNLLNIDNQSITPMNPKKFIKQPLNKNQILITKDSKLGDVAILEKNYYNYMVCAGIHSLKIKSHTFYVYALMKHHLFKNQFMSRVSKGTRHSHGKNEYCECFIPWPNKENIRIIEILSKSIVHKEQILNEKINKLNDFLSNIINKSEYEFEYKYPKITELKTMHRLDTGFYTIKTKEILNIIKNYPNGYFYLNENQLKSGNTPQNKIVSDIKIEKSVQWIQPTFINNNGLLSFEKFIKNKNKKNNINKNCCLIINRTSKGTGEYVGISMFYDFEYYGEGHHNQGIYRVEDLSIKDLITLVSLFNHPLYRTLFRDVSLGSKMKEIKISTLLKIPLPKLENNIKENIYKKYFKNSEINTNITIDNFLEIDEKWNREVGIFTLYKSLIYEKKLINSFINEIYNKGEIKTKIDFESILKSTNV